MCKIRIIRRVDESTINSSVIDFDDVNINPIDRPAYVVYVNVESRHGLSFFFSSDKEPKKNLQASNIFFEFGINSGRIYSAIVNNDSINQTDSYSVINALSSETKTERFNENIKGFIAAINQTIKFAMEHPVS